PLSINGQTLEAEVKEFSTGSLGWDLNNKISGEVDGVRVPAQIGLNLTLVGSKEIPGHESTSAGPKNRTFPLPPPGGGVGVGRGVGVRSDPQPRLAIDEAGPRPATLPGCVWSARSLVPFSPVRVPPAAAPPSHGPRLPLLEDRKVRRASESILIGYASPGLL